MRESFGSTWLFQIVIVFILIFTGYICLSINHSKAFAIKNDIILELQRNGGYTETAHQNIKRTLERAGYRTNGSCDEGWTGYDRAGEKVSHGNKGAVFCLKRITVAPSSEYPEMFYYKVRVFYQLDLPVINSFLTFTVNGDTKVIAPIK